MNDDDDILERLQRHMELSKTLGAPIERIPAKAVAVVGLVTPYLVKHTTPREAGIVMAAVYAYFAATLLRGRNDTDAACKQVHDLLDVALTVISDLEPEDE